MNKSRIERDQVRIVVSLEAMRTAMRDLALAMEESVHKMKELNSLMVEMSEAYNEDGSYPPELSKKFDDFCKENM